MKYVSGAKSVDVQEDKLHELKTKQDKENDFFKKLNYANRLKEVKKPELINKTIQDSNKNALNISLVCGQTQFVNFIVHNNSENEELYRLIISKPGDENKKDHTQDDTVQIINSPDDWKYYTESQKLIKPNDYSVVSSQNYVIIKPNESIPILLKLLSYDISMANSNYTLWVYQKNGQPLYYLNIILVKVFSVTDHVFRYYLPENRYTTIKITNPFKYDKTKTQKVLDNYYSTDVTVNIQLDPTSNDFYFKSKIQNEGSRIEFVLFLYLDPRKIDLYATWKFELISMT